jgi:hypothetical protein
MKAIWTLDKKTHVNGVLTDGTRWLFFQLYADGSRYATSKTFVHPDHKETIVKTLRAFIRGAPPPQSFDEDNNSKYNGKEE